MKPTKVTAIGFAVLVLLVSMFLIVFERNNNMRPEKALNSFSRLIEQGRIGDLSLTVYYSFVFTIMPLSVDMLVNASYPTQKVVVGGDELEGHADLFKQISSAALIPVENESRIDARVYYVFKTKHNRKIFDVAMWGADYSIYVNGLEVKSDDVFYDMIIPFAPEELVRWLESRKIYSKGAGPVE